MPISLRKRSHFLKRIISALLSGLLAFSVLVSLLTSPDAASAAPTTKTAVVQNSAGNTAAVQGQAVTSQIPDLYYNTSQLTLGNDTIEVRPYIQFDLSSIPADATVANATLEMTSIVSMFNKNNVSATVAVYGVMGAWNENTITWNSAPAFAPDPVSTQQVNGYATASKTQFDLTGLAQQWIDGSLPNYGMVLRSEHFSSGFWSRRYYPDENLTLGPKLTVTYTVNDLTVTPPQLSLVKGGSGAQLTAGSDHPNGIKPGVTWTSSDSSVAAVDANGFVTPGNTPGTATVTATTVDGRTAASTVTVPASSNADLSSLTLSQGTLSPAFSSGVTGYSATVANSVTSVDVAPTTEDLKAAGTVNGKVVASGTPSTVPLNVGNNIVKVIVTAEDGTTQKLYTITIYRAPSNSAELNGLSLSRGTLSPAFSSGTQLYGATVANSVTSVTVTPTVAEPNATVTVNGQSVASGSASGAIPLIVGDNPINVTVTAQDGATKKTYTIKVTRTASSNADLTDLSVSEGSLAPAFGSGVQQYRVNVANNVTGITVTPAFADANATIMVNGTQAASGTASPNIPLNVGDNSINVTVTAQDGSTAKTYTITVNRAPSANANLNNLSLSQGVLSPAFSSGMTAYSVSVTNSVYRMTVTPAAAEFNAVVKVNGIPVTSGTASQDIPLNVGDNAINVTVTAQDGTTTKTYSVKVTRAPSASADLTNLELSDGVLSPAFDIGTTGYTATVANSVNNLTVTPRATDANATITVNGILTASGTRSSAIPLNVGDNTINVIITAQDGTTTKIYTVKVTRAPSNSAELSHLALSEGSLSPAFASDVWSYTSTAASYVKSVRVKPWTADPNATVTVNGQPVASGAPSGLMVLNPGDNLIDVTVTAQDGTTTKTYTVNVRLEASTDANLINLALSSGSLSPLFASGVQSYSASVANDVSSVTVTPTASDLNATLSVNGNAVASGGSSPSIPLSIGSNTIKVVVTAPDGTTTKTYTVTATRERVSSSADRSSTDSPSTGVTGSGGAASDKTIGISVIVNGKVYDQLATGTTTQEDGKTVLTVTVDTAKLAAQLAKEGGNPVVIVPVAMVKADKVTALLTGDVVKAMENRQAVWDVETVNGNYKLPAAEIGIDHLSAQLGGEAKLSDIVVHVDIAKSDEGKVKLAESTAEKGKFSVVVPPVDFTVIASYNGKTAEVDKFNAYVEREIPLPDDINANKITTAAVLAADGTLYHVPTYITVRDGKYYAVVNSLTNSTYALIWNPATFADAADHWSKDAVNDMASRLIVYGADEMNYNPNTAITRAEFAAVIVRALGLNDNGKTSAYGDVKSGDWYYGAVAKAEEYGIIAGYEDGTFRPMKTVTREEAMAMIARAMKLAGLDTNVSGTEAASVLARFADGAAVHAWAKQAVAATVKSGLVQGREAGLRPTSDITRAETAAIAQRILIKAKLIDSRNSK
ncbi:DNRLRE domain-containing protein [Cohnella sp. CFH 77786]|uniref:cadherin-like beta sandwich domain-containing protein n=1 Tax=Cohnella sp. CFH 77786 TaxID=2662265 RepID=UPI001C60D3CA|nr:cadherin-like beta sandwich domain-containing protein [Cohnella sp. CFH 77786]MBW5448843.1 DNRLRE domain-containing protein [Cohnella sp. CFH 77786]